MCLIFGSRRRTAQVITAKRAVERNGPASAVGRHITKRCIRSDYEFADRVLGKGSSGEVVLATAKHDYRKYAVKSFGKCGLNKRKLARLKNEVEIHLSLDHPQVVRLERVYESNEDLHCVFECMEGGTLADRILRAEKLSPRQAAHAIREILLAVAYIHAQGVFHRDIKPDNLMYERSDSDHLKLLDFGFAANYDGRSKFTERLGTAKYCAPEVLDGWYTEKIDIWAIGVIAHILLTGTFPTIFGTQFLQSAFPCAHRLVSAMMSRDPSNRPSAHCALQHPWICKHSSDDVTVADSSILLTLKSLPSTSSFRRACLLLVAWSLPLSEQSEFRQLFESMDQDKNGTIELGEFCETFSNRLGVGRVEAEELFRLLDSNGDNKITYSEFLAGALVDEHRLPEIAVHEAFLRFDRDGSAEITPDEIVWVLGKTPNGYDLNRILEEADSDGNGSISYEEFRSFLQDPRRTDEPKDGCRTISL